MDEIVLTDGRKPAMEQVRKYFEHLFQMEQTGDPFPVDFDTVWPFAYTTKANAKRALLETGTFFPDTDYVFILPDENSSVDVKGRPREKIALSVQCFEFFVARKVRPVFEIYRECRKVVTQASRAAAAKSVIPYHLRRYLANDEQVPFGHFSILQQTVLKLIAPLEIQGYTLRDDMLPDGSLGRAFSKWLRENGHDPDGYPDYQHRYEDGRVVKARAYPLAVLLDFHRLFQEEWLVKRAPGYFEKRHKEALPYVSKMLEGRS